MSSLANGAFGLHRRHDTNGIRLDQQTTKVELMISMKTARALGITMPLSLLGRADGVLE